MRKAVEGSKGKEYKMKEGLFFWKAGKEHGGSGGGAACDA